jgi:putative SOS response-associated peptidase YedK
MMVAKERPEAMCGRYSLIIPPDAIRLLFNIIGPLPNWPPRYNLAPTESVPILRRREGAPADAADERELLLARWGLVPGWAKDLSIGARCINARAESIETTPAFRAAFTARRCLIPADGFYEWQATSEKRKQPWRIALADGGPFGFAGLWESWRAPEGQPVVSCSIVTCDANALLAPIHGRMPVILAPEDHAAWLAPETAPPALKALLKPYPAELMQVYRVSTLVNSSRNEGAELIAPVAEPIPAGPGPLFAAPSQPA